MELFFANQLLFGEEILNRLHIFAGTWLDTVMAAITATGNEIFYLLVIPVLYWCYDKKFASRIGGAFLTCVLVNESVKEYFNNPRPDPSRLSDGISQLNIRYKPKHSPGFPSGHAQNAVAFWGSLAYFAGKRNITLFSLIFILLVSYSRLYLAVHFLGDVLGGLVIGCVFLLLYIVSVAWIKKKYAFINQTAIVIAAFVAPFVLSKIMPGNEVVKTLGALSGFIIGIIYENDRIGFSPKNRPIPNIIKAFAGIVGVIAIKAGVKAILPSVASADFFRYWLIGIWITLIAPLLFTKISSLNGIPADTRD